MIKWVIELREFRIKFDAMIAIKGHALTYFIVESICPEELSPPKIARFMIERTPHIGTSTWKLQINEFSSIEG